MDLERKAIERLRLASDMSLRLYEQPLVLTYSGGKDSDALLHIAEASGIPFEVLHSLTTADAPQTVYHVRNTFARLEIKGVKCTVDKHEYIDANGKKQRTTMWNLIPRKLMPPTRWMRYCCSELKEGGGKGRFIATGVRWDESANRKSREGLEILHSDKNKKLALNSDNDENRRLFEACQLKGKRVCNPIIDWTTEDVFGYCKSEKICMNPLYSLGETRVGCIGCPLAAIKKRESEFLMFPKFKVNYIRAFDRMIIERNRRGKATTWESGIDVFHSWMEDGVLPGQEVIEGFEEIPEAGKHRKDTK